MGRPDNGRRKDWEGHAVAESGGDWRATERQTAAREVGQGGEGRADQGSIRGGPSGPCGGGGDGPCGSKWGGRSTQL
jgi:hypothetical protein